MDLAITQAGPEENEENGLRAVAVPPMGNSFTTTQGASGRDLTPDGLKKCDCFAVGNYTKMRKLGSGAFSTVYLARYNPKSAIVDDVGVCRAIKVIQKEILTPEDKEGLHSEIAILLELKSPLVMALYEVYESPTAYQMVTELIEGGELFERIVEKEKYTEKRRATSCATWSRRSATSTSTASCTATSSPRTSCSRARPTTRRSRSPTSGSRST